ncbi:hypothetical protein C8F04DRAFT_1142988 [Mycena alexandri]|uniref:Uncharacterized protein n=1 Tax=Mycena alexandri TaxID=1745969 RepID=A0AAD6S5V5_9AGAR|nr:hypothetical protein C8F04DRAFT_1142988 [Mycena alexandri]
MGEGGGAVGGARRRYVVLPIPPPLVLPFSSLSSLAFASDVLPPSVSAASARSTALSSRLLPLLRSPFSLHLGPQPRPLPPIIQDFDTTIPRTTPLLRMREYAGANTRCVPAPPLPVSSGAVESHVVTRTEFLCAAQSRASSKAAGSTFPVPSYIHIHFRLSSLLRISAPQLRPIVVPLHAWPWIYPQLLRFFPLQTSLA